MQDTVQRLIIKRIYANKKRKGERKWDLKVKTKLI